MFSTVEADRERVLRPRMVGWRTPMDRRPSDRHGVNRIQRYRTLRPVGMRQRVRLRVEDGLLGSRTRAGPYKGRTLWRRTKLT